MKFFLPGVDDPADAVVLYAHIRQNVSAQWGGRTLDPGRFYSIRFMHNGRRIVDTVGKLDPDQREYVLAIIKVQNGPFMVVTASRGFQGPNAMVVADDSTFSVVEFELEL